MKYCIPLFSILIALLVCACNSPELIGVELLEGEEIDIQFTNSITLPVSTVEDDSVLIFATNGFLFRNSEQWPVGEYSDPAFGDSKSVLYLTPGIGIASFPDFTDATFDSLVMILPLDTLARYGDTLSPYDINVFRLDEFPSSSTVIEDRIDTIYAFEEFAFDPTVVGNLNTIPSYYDSLEVYSPALDSIIDVPPSLRILMDDALGLEFLDTVNVATDSMFQSIARGFALTAEGDNPGYIGLNLENFSSSSTNATLAMYHKDSVGVRSQYNFALGVFRSATYTNDYTGSEISMALSGDTNRTYIEGLGGVNTKVDLSEVMQFADRGINYAELEITVDESTITDETPAISDIFATYEEDGSTFAVIDFNIGVQASLLDFVFDGSLQTVERNGQDVTVYKLILTNHIIALLNGEVTSPIIELFASSKIETPYRSILYGNSGDENEIKLNLVVTTP